jgi:hypothetical protein
MVRIILFGLMLKVLAVRAQPGCTFTPANYDAYYANTTSVYTGTTTVYFLCGPNTVLYDTISNAGNCSWGMIDSASTAIYKGFHNCAADSRFFIKNYGTLILKNSGSPVTIIAEPLATVVVQTSVTIFSYSCNTILLPNCAEVGFRENSLTQSQMIVFPNPNNGNFRIRADRIPTNNGEIILYNNIGEEVWRELTLFEGNISAPLKTNLPEGIYFMKLRGKNGKFYYDRLIISR